MLDALVSPDAPEAEKATLLLPMRPTGLDAWRASLGDREQAWFEANCFRAIAGETLAFPNDNGQIAFVCVGLGESANDPLGDPNGGPFVFARIAQALTPGLYRVATETLPDGWQTDAAIAFAMTAYSFKRYRKTNDQTTETISNSGPRLVWPDLADRPYVTALLEAVALVRDLVNTPAEDMGPGDLAVAARSLANQVGAQCHVIAGERLLAENFPLIHAVGRASDRAPCLIDLRWGNDSDPSVTIVGKGVCFDTGGLDIKSSSNMRLMKKDMGGAAHALGLARMIMTLRLPIRLRVLIPAVDNAVSGASMRPGDILRSRNGTNVEIGNTDAEGRLILADALSEAGRENPDLLVDLATLTGAARAALGPDLPALFTTDDSLAEALISAGMRMRDPLWRLPLWSPYEAMNESPVADISNAGEGGFAGAITAALFLKAFVGPTQRWAHVDLFAWRPAARPGRPQGAAAQCLRPLYEVIRQLADQSKAS